MPYLPRLAVRKGYIQGISLEPDFSGFGKEAVNEWQDVVVPGCLVDENGLSRILEMMVIGSQTEGTHCLGENGFRQKFRGADSGQFIVKESSHISRLVELSQLQQEPRLRRAADGRVVPQDQT